MIVKGALFFQIMQKVKEKSVLSEIIEFSKKNFDLLPLKLQQLIEEKICKNYRNLQNKYYITKQLTIDQHNWKQCQKRLFVIFILCFEYFLQKQNVSWDKQLWNRLSHQFFSKDPDFLQFQYLSLLKVKNRISWTKQQDNMLIQYISKQQQSNISWNQISKKIFYSTKKAVFKSAKHCRERWLNHLDNKKIHGNWKPQDDYAIFTYVLEKGKRWCKVVPILNNTRTQHMIKNRYNSLINRNTINKRQKEEVIAKRIYNDLKKTLTFQSNKNIKPQENNQEVNDYQIMEFQEPQNGQREEIQLSSKQQIQREDQKQVRNQIQKDSKNKSNIGFNMVNQIPNNLYKNCVSLPQNLLGYYYGFNNYYYPYPTYYQSTSLPLISLEQSNLMQGPLNFYIYNQQA